MALMRDDLCAAAGQALSAISRGLGHAAGEQEGRAEVLRWLAEQDVSRGAFRVPKPTRAAACRYLPETVGAAIMVDSALAAAIAGLEEDLSWRHPDGYGDAEMGQSDFTDNYAHAEIIGPSGCFAGQDFRLGLLLLGPRLHYRDHFHPAPELYWILSGSSEWKCSDGGFVTHQPGETIWHESGVVHATRTLDQPLLALWAWTRDVDGPVTLVGG
jgi:hypothetical protein